MIQLETEVHFTNTLKAITMRRLYYLFSILCILVPKFVVWAQSPPSLTSDVDLTVAACGTNLCSSFPSFGAFFSSEAQIQNAFNEGRRQEETQLGLPTNSLGNLVLPVGYSSLSVSEKALLIINMERVARAGKTYTIPSTVGPVLGLPLAGIDAPLNTLAENYADSLVKYDGSGLSHTLYGTTPYTRISSLYGECAEFNARAENLYYSCGGSSSYVVEQALFSWIYRDASSGWGHRAAVLIQDVDPVNGQNGFDNNQGSSASEGFLGIGVVTNVSGYSDCSQGANLVVMNIMDPSTASGCSFSPLPVSLISFDVKKVGNDQVNLLWKTTSELDNQGFEVQRSLDMKSWMKLGFVASSEGIANAGTKNYSFIDENPELGLQFYRLKQLDWTNNFEVFPAKEIYIDFGDEFAPLAFPNPVVGSVKIKNLAANSPFEVYTMKGELQSTAVYNPDEGIYLGNQKTGVYLLRFLYRGKWYSKKVVKY